MQIGLITKPTNKFMKRLSLYLFLIFFTLQTPSQTDDIRDFQIEGMSIGDSLLDYLTEEEIKEKMRSNTAAWYPDEAFVSIAMKLETFKTYDDLGIVFKPNDNNYVIHSLEGSLYFGRNINECYKKQKVIGEDLEILFGNKVKIQRFDADYIGDKSGESKVRHVDFIFNDGSASRVICYDLSEKLHEKNNEQDSLYTVINSKEFMDWLNESM